MVTTGQKYTDAIFYEGCTIRSTEDFKWQVLVNDEGVIENLGTYDKIEEAIERYQLFKEKKK